VRGFGFWWQNFLLEDFPFFSGACHPHLGKLEHNNVGPCSIECMFLLPPFTFIPLFCHEISFPDPPLSFDVSLLVDKFFSFRRLPPFFSYPMSYRSSPPFFLCQHAFFLLPPHLPFPAFNTTFISLVLFFFFPNIQPNSLSLGILAHPSVCLQPFYVFEGWKRLMSLLVLMTSFLRRSRPGDTSRIGSTSSLRLLLHLACAARSW